MVNLFGNEAVRGKKGDHGPSGAMGLPEKRGEIGDSGFIEGSCFFINDPLTDVEQEEKTIITWVSRKKHKKNNLIADIPSKQLSEKLINDRYALVFDGATRYYSAELGFLPVDPGNFFGFYA